MKVVAENRRARYDYFLTEQFEAGLVLRGWEVKSARANNVSLSESFIQWDAERHELWLKNAYFAPYQNGDGRDQEPRRNRQLLLRKSELAKIAKGVAVKGNTCVPLKIYFSPRGWLKMVVALAAGKHAYDKKETLKQRDLQREAARETRQHLLGR